MKVLVAGDLHANYTAAKLLVEAVEETGVDVVWQVGDFGYWPRFDHNEHFMAILGKAPAKIYFADGNHEDHAALNSENARGIRQLTDNVFHVSRGMTIEFENGARTLFFGGARSVDRTYRTPGVDWFPEELPTEDQWARAADAKNIDYVVAHEVPNWVDFGYPAHGSISNPWPMTDTLVSENMRIKLEVLAKQLDPTIWFGGHHHVRKTVAVDFARDIPVRTEVLHCDGHIGCFVILDTTTGKVEDIS